MKKIILSITAIALLTMGVKAQAPDFGFDAWSNVSFFTVQDPNGWTSLNVLNGAGTGTALSVTKETTTHLHTGAASAGIKTVKVLGASIPNPYRPGKNLDTAGILSVGKTQISAPYIITGYGYAQRPTVLSFASKYNPAGAGDSAFVLAILTKWNVNKRDTIAGGKYSTGVNTTTYSTNSLTLTYNPLFTGVIPDSMRIFISSSVFAHDGAKIGSTFYIDALAWSNFVGINDRGVIDHNVSVFPNPSNDQINFNSSVDASTVEIMDVTGRLVGSYKMMDNKVAVQTTSFVRGSYLYNVLNDNKEVINRGKFEVTK
ncbi:MAG: T9SS type A sorting domain-containing protein [Bacteroidota bacterium]